MNPIPAYTIVALVCSVSDELRNEWQQACNKAVGRQDYAQAATYSAMLWAATRMETQLISAIRDERDQGIDPIAAMMPFIAAELKRHEELLRDTRSAKEESRRATAINTLSVAITYLKNYLAIYGEEAP
jgi:hypothetical protein